MIDGLRAPQALKGFAERIFPKFIIMEQKMGLYWDNGKDNGNYYSILGLHSWVGDITPIMENQMEKNTEHEMEARGT